jgi:hypothetical protein
MRVTMRRKALNLPVYRSALLEDWEMTAPPAMVSDFVDSEGLQ